MPFVIPTEEERQFLIRVGEVLHNNLKIKRVSLMQLKKDTGVTPSTFRRIINGKQNPTLSTLIRLCAYLDVSMVFTNNLQKGKK